MAFAAAAVLKRAQEVGLVVWLEDDDVLVEGSPTPEALATVEILKEHQVEVATYLRQYGDGQLPPLDRPIANEQELRRWMDWTADPKRFAQWLEWAMTDESTNY